MMTWAGGGVWGELIHVYMGLSLRCSPETVTTLFVIFYTPTQNRKFKKKKENFKLKKERDFQPI